VNFLECKVTGCSRFSLLRWVSIEPTAKSDVSVSTITGCLGSKWARIEAEVNRFLSWVNACSPLGVHFQSFAVSFLSSVIGRATRD
jgi:hypothetical protein